MSKSIRAFYLGFALSACRTTAPPGVVDVADPQAAAAAVAEGRAVLVRDGPLGPLAVGLGSPVLLHRMSTAPAALGRALAGQTPERLLLMPGPSWSEADELALCQSARAATLPALPCERVAPDLLEDPDAKLTVSVLTRGVHASPAIELEAAATVAAADTPRWTDCYRAARRSRPAAAGRIVLEVAIGADGAVKKAAVTQGWDQPDFERCVVAPTAGWRFDGVAPGTLIAFPLMFVAR